MDLGYLVARFLMESRLECAFTVNRKEITGQWYRTPRELGICEISRKEVKRWKPDLIITAFYHRILHPDIYELPGLGAWNIHLGDAERYRGAYPSIRALINGDAAYGVTLHRIDRSIDTGDILAKLSFNIPPGSTGRDLYDLMTEKGFELFMQCWNDLITGAALTGTRPQNGQQAETMYRRELEHRLYPPEGFVNAVRALTFPPFPPPYFISEGRKFIIIEDSRSESDQLNSE
jgi:methionyl-tRNA formyltransferase